MLPRMSVRGPNFSSCQFPRQSGEGDNTVFGFFLQFVFASVRLQCAASCRSVVKDSRFFFVPTGMLFVVQFGLQHTNTLWVALCQRTAFVMSSFVS